MSFKRLIVLIVGLLPLATVCAQGPGKAMLRVDEAGDGTIAVSFQWGNFFVGIADDRYDELQAEGMTLECGEVGKPALPTMSTVVTLPRGSRLTLGTLEHSEEMWDRFLDAGRPLAPTVEAWVKDSVWPGYRPDMKTYTADAYYRGGEPLEIKHIGTMGSSEVYRITVRPVAYNPVRQSLLVSTVLQASLSKDIPLIYMPDASLPRRYMIVTRPQFCEGLQAFVEWKRQEGFDVELLLADTNKRDAVKALIESHWETADGRWPEYILLVGDAAQLQSYLGTTRPQGLNNHITDLYYADHTGDHLPDAMIGRWPVNDTAELRAVVEKTLRYKQCRGLDNSMLGRALLVAGKENSTPAPVTTNGQVNYLKGRLAEEYPGIDTLCHHNPASDNERPAILAEIAQGTSFINYTAHCGTGGWSHPAVGFTSIDTLGCSQPTLYVNNCCQSNDFGGTCFGESLLRKPLGGAIGVIGATNSTLWNEDYYWAVGPKYPFSLEPSYDSLHRGAFDLWLDGDATTLGALMTAGNMSVLAFGSPYEKFYWEIYCLLGDPSLRPYLGAPGHISLWTPDTLTVGATEVRVSGTEGATVSVVQGDRLLGAAVLDDHRSMAIPFRQSADTLPIIVTATMAQAVPVTDTIYMTMPQGHAVAFRDVSVHDTTVDLSLANLCADTLYDITVQLLCNDTTQAVFDATPAYADTLLPWAEVPMHISLSVLQWERLWSGELIAYSTPDIVDCASLKLHGRLDGVPPTLQFTLLDADSTAATSIEPNSNYLLLTSVEGIYDSINVTVTALPTNSTLITQLSTLNSQLSTLNSGLSTPDTITHLHIEATVTRGNYSRDYELWMVAGCRQDSFDEGFDSHPWDRSSLRPWIIDSTEHHSGAYCMRSAPIVGRQTSDMGLDLTLGAADSISFWAKASSEQNYDKLLFYIDGVRQMELSGNAGWRRCAFPIEAGNHRLLWRYVKDDSGDNGSDCGWVDDVQLPLAQWDTQCGWFGTIDTVLAINSPLITPHSSLSIVPNPTNGKVTIEGAVCITLIDLNGRRLMTADGPTIDLGALPAGTYIAAINTGTTIVYEKITRQ